MNPTEIMNGMAEKNRLLTSKNDEYVVLSEKHAAAKKDYLTGYAIKITTLKLDNTPVTVIKELAKGDKNVAKLGYEMDVSKGVMDACKESMADIRAALDSYRSILTWLRTEMQNANIQT